MSLAATIAVICAAAAAGAVVMLALRRRASAGGRFTDSDRASGVFGLLGAAFAILLGFVVLLAFESFSAAETAGADEAAAVRNMHESARLFEQPARDIIRGDLVCYARSVIALEWPRLSDGRRDSRVDAWAAAVEDGEQALRVNDDRAGTAFGSFLEARNARETARRDRLLEAGNPIPSVLIVLLVLAAIVVLVYVCLYADSGEPALPQAFMMASVAALVAASLLGVRFLDTPYGDHPGALKPEEMRYTLTLMTREGSSGTLPCSADGRPA